MRGEEDWDWFLLESNIPLDQLDGMEKLWISKFDTFHNGYNSTSGGEQKKIFSKEARKKMSISARKKFFSEEHKRHISESHIGNQWALGFNHTIETRIKMSDARKGINNGNYKHGIYCSPPGNCLNCSKKLSRHGAVRCLQCFNVYQKERACLR